MEGRKRWKDSCTLRCPLSNGRRVCPCLLDYESMFTDVLAGRSMKEAKDYRRS